MNINQREKYEWSNYWWDNADDFKLPRILLIGDSISVGYRPYVTELLKGYTYVDLMATSKGVCDSAFKKELKYILGEYKYKIIHVNNGLHALQMTDDVYKTSLTECVEFIKDFAPNSKIIWASSTPITKINGMKTLDDKNNIVVNRNMIAKNIMKSHNIPINDLYNVMLNKHHLRMEDGYHYKEEGKKIQSKEVVKAIKEILFLH